MGRPCRLPHERTFHRRVEKVDVSIESKQEALQLAYKNATDTRMKMIKHVKIFLLVGLTPLAVSAQNFDVNWFTMDGGGGASTGGPYSLSGTIGQPDAGRMSGGTYSLSGGFWSGADRFDSDSIPTLAIEKLDTGVRVFWPVLATKWLFEETDTMTGTWSEVMFPYSTNTSTIGITVESLRESHFYRLRKP